MQGAAATLAEQALRLDYHPDVVLATDMLNLPVFLGLARQKLSNIPTFLYCHENQLTYPLPPGESRDLTYGMANWLSMLAADQVLFNSVFHLEDWFEELPRLLKHFPDYTHTHLVPVVREKAAVLPVGCDLRRLQRGQEETTISTVPLILWNQRWEYDKDPVTFFRAVDELVTEGYEFRIALAGSNVRQMPEEFEAARDRLGSRVIHYGHADHDTYQRLLWEADIVVSTAIHEFFGIGVVEAIYCGCFPVLPRRLAYPELISPTFHNDCLYGSYQDLLSKLRWALTNTRQAQQMCKELQKEVDRFDWSKLAPEYDRRIEENAGR
jgi:glycosyltransferase involved in cell wall biosynthesis